METLKNLMGSAYKEDLTLEEVDKFLANGNYVNLKDGGYVAKDKYEKLEGKFKTLETEFETHKEQTKDYETLKTENETFKSEKADADLKAKLVNYGIDEKSIAYVKSDITSKVLSLSDDPKVEEANVKQYLKDHPMFAQSKAQNPAPTKTITVSTSAGEGASAKPTQAERNASINQALRDAIGVGEK